jgi:hypothetical protein
MRLFTKSCQCMNTQRINSFGTEEGMGEQYTGKASVLIARIRASL